MSPEDRRTRLRFDDFSLERFPDGRCTVQVGLDWTRGRSYLGEAQGTQTLEGELRAAAGAALEGIQRAADGRVTLELRGAKAVRAFDAWIVVVSVKGQADAETYRLMGAYPCSDEDTPRGAVMAVLVATNRIMERFLEP
ncbi:MAG: hypothetical protein ACQET1_07500 [Gemmatimonadota bacterium]